MHRPSERDVKWMSPVQGKSPPVQVKEPYGYLDMVTPETRSVQSTPKEGLAVYREKIKKRKKCLQ